MEYFSNLDKTMLTQGGAGWSVSSVNRSVAPKASHTGRNEGMCGTSQHLDKTEAMNCLSVT